MSVEEPNTSKSIVTQTSVHLCFELYGHRMLLLINQFIAVDAIKYVLVLHTILKKQKQCAQTHNIFTYPNMITSTVSNFIYTVR